jgi:hypothetical protein
MNPNLNMQMNVLKPNCPQLLGADWKSDTEMKYMYTQTESIVIHEGLLFWARFPPQFQVPELNITKRAFRNLMLSSCVLSQLQLKIFS